MRTRGLLAALAAFAACGTAVAQDTGIYVGAAAGEASYREVCNDASTLVGTAASVVCLHKEDVGIKGFVGWRFYRYLAAELSYIDFGSVSASGSASGGAVTATTKAKAAGVSALGFLPLGERLSIFGRLGLLQSRVSTKSEGTVVAQDEHGETELHVGIGAQFNLSGRWALRGEYERMNDTRIDLISLGAQYRF